MTPASAEPTKRQVTQRPEPHVGIFWQVLDAAGTPHLVFDAEPLTTAEPYGDFLTHPRGHYDVWAQWRRRGSRFLTAHHWPLTILTTEYDEHPRGRVVLHILTNTFWIYADHRLQHRTILTQIKAAIGLTSEHSLIKSDDHYR
jgi:hypothetical protein